MGDSSYCSDEIEANVSSSPRPPASFSAALSPPGTPLLPPSSQVQPLHDPPIVQTLHRCSQGCVETAPDLRPNYTRLFPALPVCFEICHDLSSYTREIGKHCKPGLVCMCLVFSELFYQESSLEPSFLQVCTVLHLLPKPHPLREFWFQRGFGFRQLWVHISVCCVAAA